MPEVLETYSFGPITKGVLERANPTLGPALGGALRHARGLAFSGVGRFGLRAAPVVQLTMMDDVRAITINVAGAAATAGDLGSITNGAAAYGVNAHAGRTVEVLTGPGAGQRGVVASNTATKLVLTAAGWTEVPALAVAPTNASTFQIVTINTPAAPVSNGVAVAPAADYAVAVGFQLSETDAYLYKLTPTMDGWYDSTGLLHAGSLHPEPFGVLWAAMSTPPEVTITDGLGIVYVAHAKAADAAGLYWPTKTFDGAAIATYQADLDGTGAKPIYASAVIAFQTALWLAGFGVGAVPATGYRPELARFTPPNFDPLRVVDSLTIGRNVRSERERIIGFGVAGNAMFIGGAFITTRITGYGRDSWYRDMVDQAHGFVSHKCMASDGEFLYFWSKRGPMRIAESGPAEPLWDPLPDTVKAAVNLETVVAYRDEPRDQVVWLLDISAGARVRVAYDTRRALFCSTDDDEGVVFRGAGDVDPIVRATAVAAPTSAPAGPPTAATTTLIGTTTATAGWTAGDLAAQTEVWVRRVADADFTLVTTLFAGVQAYVFTGLAVGTDYEWKVRHLKGGISSAFLGPTAFTTRTLVAGLLPPTNLTLTALFNTIFASWNNAGETLCQTEVQFYGPSGVVPSPALFFTDQTADPGVAFATIDTTHSLLGTAGTFWVRVRHVRAGATPSDYAGPVSVEVTPFDGGLGVP